MKFSKLVIFGFIICSNYIEASEVVNISHTNSINEKKNNTNSDLSLCNKSIESCKNIIYSINKYQQIQDKSIETILNYLYPVLKIFVSDNHINNETQKLQDYVNNMSGLV